MKSKYISLISLIFLLGIYGCMKSVPEETEEVGSLTGTQYEVRKQRIIEYFTERQNRYEVVATTKTQSGQTIDWIKPESQVTGGNIAPVPKGGVEIVKPKDTPGNPFLDSELPEALLETMPRDLSSRTEIQTDKSAMGPEGTVPIVRFDVEAYLEENPEFLPEDPSEIFSKVPPPAPASNNRYYAVWRRYGDNYGSMARINIWDTAGPVGGETSIAQVAVIKGSPMQAIEAGKIEHISFAPAKRPVIFTYFRTSGAASGDWVGGYNTLVDGWIQVSSTVAPGLSLVPWESSAGGSQYSIDVEVKLVNGNWWVKAAGEWAGYYPYCKGGGSPPCDQGTLFSESGIRDKAFRVDWYGEIYDESAPAATSTDMGSGAFADQRWTGAAYFRNIQSLWTPHDVWWWDSGSISTTDSACYSADGPYYSSNPHWRNWFYYGGPGKEAAGCN